MPLTMVDGFLWDETWAFCSNVYLFELQTQWKNNTVHPEIILDCATTSKLQNCDGTLGCYFIF